MVFPRLLSLIMAKHNYALVDGAPEAYSRCDVCVCICVLFFRLFLR